MSETIVTRRGLIAGAGATLVLAGPARAGLFGKDGVIYTRRGRAIRGTDPVAYFTEGRPVQGDDAHSFEWMDATWTFASSENRDAFAADPAAFAPQFGGYCAWAVSRNYTASTTPEAWTIVDGKLYLNYSLGVQRQWAGDIPGNIALGHANWPNLRADLAA